MKKMVKEWVSFQAQKEKRVPLRGAKDVAPPQKVVQRQYEDKGTYMVTIEYNPQGMWYKDITRKIDKKDAQVTSLEMPESGVILEPGAPMLPIEGLYIALPSGAELVGITVGETETMEFPGEVDVVPAPEPTKDGGKYDWKEPEYKPKKKIYKSDAEYPEELFKLLSVDYIGSVKIAHCIMYPLHYKPKSKKLIIYNKIELKAEYTPGLGIAKMRGPAAAPPPEAEQPVAPRAAQMQMELQDQVLNLDAVEDLRSRADGAPRRVARPVSSGPLSKITNKGQYLIITTEDLVEPLKRLAKSKEDKGMTAQIVTDKQIYDEFQESGEPKFKSIRDFVLYAYDNWDDPPEYVLLVGEIGKIPTRNDPNYNCPSDWYYSNLIGDVGPDLSLGRVAINDPQKLKKYIDKVFAYEKADGDWIKRALFTTYQRYDYEECSDDCVEIISQVRGMKAIKRYGSNSTKPALVKEIDKGCGIINYRGHGSEWEWQSANGIGVNDCALLKNKNKCAVVFSICCLNNAIDVSQECFGEAFIEAENGAVAFLGASRPSYTAPNHHFDRYIYRAIVDKKLRKVGKIFNYATVTLHRNFPDVYTKENIAMYLLLGDPSLEIKFPS